MIDADASSINVIGLVFLVTMGALSLVLPRRFATLPLIVTACCMTLGQQIVIEGLHFSALRIIICLGWIRLFVREEISPIKLNVIDKLIIVYVFVGCLNNIVLWWSFRAVQNQAGFAYDVIGTYFLFRVSVRDISDIERTIKITGALLFPLLGFMILEKLTGSNLFSIFGGVPEMTIVRDGHFRCQGPFRQPILAGTFGATMLPLLLGLRVNLGGWEFWLKLSIASTALITLLSASSGPVMAYGIGVIGLLAWMWRAHMRFISWGLVAFLVLLHMVMKAPVWFLMARITIFASSTGWHRAELIDQAINHLSEWWLIGTKHTAHWMPYVLSINPTTADITNQYVSEGIGGGLARMFLFISVIVACYKRIGRVWRGLEQRNYPVAFLVWSMGSCVLVHMVTFLSVSYFDQMILFYYMVISFIATIGTPEAVIGLEQGLGNGGDSGNIRSGLLFENEQKVCA